MVGIISPDTMGKSKESFSDSLLLLDKELLEEKFHVIKKD